MRLNQLTRLLDAQLMTSLLFLLILPIRTTLWIQMTHITIICLLFCAIIVNLLIMIVILVLFVLIIDVTCESFEKKSNEMTYQMMETMKAKIAACSQCFK